MDIFNRDKEIYLYNIDIISSGMLTKKPLKNPKNPKKEKNNPKTILIIFSDCLRASMITNS